MPTRSAVYRSGRLVRTVASGRFIRQANTRLSKHEIGAASSQVQCTLPKFVMEAVWLYPVHYTINFGTIMSWPNAPMAPPLFMSTATLRMKIDGKVPDPATASSPRVADRIAQILNYMGLKPVQAMRDVAIDPVFTGSCSNGLILERFLRPMLFAMARQRFQLAPNARMVLLGKSITNGPVTCLSSSHLSLKSQGAYASQM